MTKEQHEYIQKLLRDRFDLVGWYNGTELDTIIAITKQLGYTEQAQEMESDLEIKAC